MEANKREATPCPKDSANALSSLMFFWTIPIFRKGYRKTLEREDLYDALYRDQSNKLGDTLEANYAKELTGLKPNGEKKKGSLAKALLKTLWTDLLYLGSLAVFNELVVKLTMPYLLGMFLKYFEPESEMQRETAVWCAAGIVVLNGASALCMNHYTVGAFHMGMRARVACCSLIYRKALKLSRTALGESATGKVVNLLSNDVNRFDVASMFLHYLWVAPLASLFVLYFLWIEIGISGLFGILVVFTVVPIQSYTGKLAAKYRLQTALKTDERVRLMGEIISGVQVIKMYAWEKPFQILIELARKLEIKVIKKSSYVRAVYMTFLMSTTRIAVFCVMISMVLLGHKLTAAKIFVVATYFNLLSQTMSAMFVRAIAETAEAAVAIKRLEKFFHNDEFVDTVNSISADGNKDPQILNNGELKPSRKTLVSILKGEAKWLPESKELTLQIDEMNIKKGKLIGVIGSVGSGKSSLLQAILGELQLTNGSMEVNGNLSYACQEPWVFGASIRQNILFGQPYEKNRYNQVVRVCALQADFLQFPHGDQTLVGERGTSLSGGQKARVNLARSVYRNTDIYLLDDPLSAVDTHVGRQLFDQCIVEHLKHKTRILVTHQLHYLEAADHIILLKNGKISMQGSFHELSTRSGEYAQLAMSAPPAEDAEDAQSLSSMGASRERSMSKSKFRRMTSRNKRSESVTSSVMDIDDVKMEVDSDDDEEDEAENKPQVAEAEASSKDVVEGSVFYEYFKAGGGYLTMFFIAGGFIVCQVAASAADYWMSFWTTQEELREYYLGQGSPRSALMLSNSTDPLTDYTVVNDSLLATTDTSFVPFFATSPATTISNRLHYPDPESLLTTETCMWAYSVIAVSLLTVSFMRSITFYNIAMRSSQKLHDVMFRGVIRSPMRFFHTNPSGRIINRFSKDMGNIDEWLPKAILDASQVLLQMVGSIVLACYSNPYFLLPIGILSIFFLLVRKIYLKTSKNIKRLEGISRSPVFTHLNATLQGLSTIRAYGAQQILKDEFDSYQDSHTAAWYLFIATSSAFGLVLDVLCLVLVAIVTFTFLFISTSVMGGRVGLGISQSMSMTFIVQWGVRQSAEVANQLMAVERVLEYKLLPPENGIEPDEIDKKSKKQLPKLKQPPVDWPEDGRVEFKDYSMKYTEEPSEPFVLRDLRCVIESREKVGIVGRTGAGKSSLISALFRLAYGKGSVIIDNVDTKDISLENLRKKISIIPQDPVLFSGTLRRNLDPFEEFSDNSLWQALDEVELKESLSSAAGLEARVMDEGSNFSVGQRQLICLARALLRNNRLLMLDEATANVDPHTDSLIQKTIRDKFLDCTVLTVAHRLNTIMDSDKVLVMDKGKMVEFDHPYKLLQKKEGFLTAMVAETGNQNAELLLSLAKESYLKNNQNIDIEMIDD